MSRGAGKRPLPMIIGPRWRLGGCESNTGFRRGLEEGAWAGAITLLYIISGSHYLVQEDGLPISKLKSPLLGCAPCKRGGRI
ncbi:hypothetical protein Micbo1qcDRAFT_24122 [Microdochium bolleyi]|uniref:Uncharacterized protein n=1 Tax=Microdochium bolleyi TaxID=196109 RepID=A0A136JD49_9PEZI|nr:hypothetical protein Micbo1qcDRAFT_24122 [Microdochium bolleyi]